MVKEVAVIGAGLTGSLLASLLAQLGFQVDVYEKRQDEEKDSKASEEFGFSTNTTKRSINLALSDRGIVALEKLGLVSKVLENAIRMPRRVIHSLDGSIQTQQYGIGDQTLWSVGRNTINNILKDNLLNDPSGQVRLHFEHTLISADKTGLCQFLPSTGKPFSKKFDLVIGADGAFSRVRESLLQQYRISFSRQYVRHGYKEINIPPKNVVLADGTNSIEYALSCHEGLHIWPRGDFMLIALPNPDKSFTATLFAPYQGEPSFAYLDKKTNDEIKEFFQCHFPDILNVVPDVVSEYRNNPVGSLQTIRTNPWNYGQVTLIGDAAHAIVPFYGQGMNAGFQDGVVLFDILADAVQKCGNVDNINIVDCLTQFDHIRRPAINALADLCLSHYHDMASNTASRFYLLSKQLEKHLHYWFPSIFIPEYTLIAFTQTPYDEAIARVERQDQWLRGIIIGSLSTITLGLSWGYLTYVKRK